MVRATQEKIFNETATIERAGRIFGAYFSTRRLAAFVTSNARDANDFIQTIRHEILGHFGLNAFRRAIPISRNHSKLRRSFVLHVK